MDKEQAIRIASDYVDYLTSSDSQISAAYLFGSYSRGTFNQYSDIDIAVIYKKLEHRFDTQVKLLMLTPKFDTRIEPHPIEESDLYEKFSPFAEAIKMGVKIYPKDSELIINIEDSTTVYVDIPG